MMFESFIKSYLQVINAHPFFKEVAEKRRIGEEIKK